MVNRPCLRGAGGVADGPGAVLIGHGRAGWHHGQVLSQVFGPEESWPNQDLVALSDEVDPELVVEAYRAGVFPMPLPGAAFEARIGWWSPVRRGHLPLAGLRVTRSLRQSCRRYQVSLDRDFAQVMTRCADPSRAGGWIDAEIRTVYEQLHHAGLAHSVETWDRQGRLVGGLYGVSLGGLFAGESMFHDPQLGRDASKVALVRLVEVLQTAPGCLLDVQWVTDHLASLGAQEVPRLRYLAMLDDALQRPGPDWAAAQG